MSSVLLALESIDDDDGVSGGYGFRFFVTDEERDVGLLGTSGVKSCCTVFSITFRKDPTEPWRRARSLRQAPGSSGNMGDGNGVISVIAARAGELIADPGDFEYDEFMLIVESEVLSGRAGMTIGGVMACARRSRCSRKG